jgi:RND family efflux transporter MFP subunit
LSTPRNTEPRSPWKWRVVALAILAAGVAGFIGLQVFKPRPQVRPPAKELPIVQVAPMTFREGALSVTGNGLVKARAEVGLATEVSGRVVYVSPALVTGGAFARDETLIRLDPEPFRAALAQATAERVAAEAALRLAEQLLKRTEGLIERNYLSRQTLDERVASRDQARASLDRATALEKQRRIDLARAEIRAPFKGRVLCERVDAGETVQPGKELARIFADDVLEVAVSLTDRDMALIGDAWQRARATSAPATLSVEHGGIPYRWPARVDRVEAAVDSATRTFSIIVRVDSPNARGKPTVAGAPPGPPLLVGMYATVVIEGRDVGRYAVFPRRGLRNADQVWIVGPNDKVAIKSVQILRETEELVVASADGIAQDARVIVSELRVVTEGMAVRIVEGDASPWRAQSEPAR